jgi:hypothetical protein
VGVDVFFFSLDLEYELGLYKVFKETQSQTVNARQNIFSITGGIYF